MNKLRNHLHSYGLENSYQSVYKAETDLLLIKNEVHLFLVIGEPRYYWTSLLLLKQLITPLCSIALRLGLVYVELTSSGSLSI